MTATPDLLAAIVAATERITEVRRQKESLAALERRAAGRTPRGDEFGKRESCRSQALATGSREGIRP